MKLFLTMLLFAIGGAQAETNVLINKDNYSFNHPTCLIRFDRKQEFGDKLARKLKEKGFKLQDFLPDGKLNPEDMYFSLTIERIGTFFKDCKMTYKICEANTVKPVLSDLKLLESQTVRTLPRVTFSGDERCTRAIDDLFVDVPTCKSGKIMKKKK